MACSRTPTPFAPHYTVVRCGSIPPPGEPGPVREHRLSRSTVSGAASHSRIPENCAGWVNQQSQSPALAHTSSRVKMEVGR